MLPATGSPTALDSGGGLAGRGPRRFRQFHPSQIWSERKLASLPPRQCEAEAGADQQRAGQAVAQPGKAAALEQ